MLARLHRPRPPWDWPVRSRPFAAAGAVATAVTVVALANPFKHHLAPACPLHALTGLYCPFCGGTRATWAAAHLHFGLMMHEDALYPAIVLVALWGWLAWLGRATGRWRLPMLRSRAFDVTAGVVLVAFMVLRNVPGVGLAPPVVA
jgi:Protein of unknown function (DUF2752)